MDDIARQVRPDDPALETWCRDYWHSHQARFTYDVELTHRHVRSGAHILEVGSTPPFLTAALRDDYEVVGLDLDPSRFAGTIDALGLDVRRCDIEAEPFPFPDSGFDAVIFNEVFEHLRINPVATMREVHRVLSTGGLLMLSTPNLWSARGLANLLFRQRAYAVAAEPFSEFSKLEQIGHMGHVREYTSREMVTFLTAVGFQVIDVVYRGAMSRRDEILGRCIPILRPFMSLICTKQ